MFEQLLELGEQPYTQADAEWDAFVAQHTQASLLQSTQWARLKGRFGWTSQRVWLKKEGQIVAGAQILFRSYALGVVRIGYIPHGPLLNWQDEEQAQVLFNQIDWAAYQHRAGFIKIEPLLWQEEIPTAVWQANCTRYGLTPAVDTIQPPRTSLIDLRPSLDDILAAMKQKTRYNIRLASKKEIVVREGTAQDIPAFIRLMNVTGQRDGFGIHAPDYYRAAYELFAPDNAALFLAEYQEKPLAGLMIFRSGPKAAYLYGASSSEERERMPTYALQWAAIQWAKERGCTEYDLWGIPDAPEEELEAGFEQRHDGLWGVYRFKRGFNGRILRTVGAVDRIYNPRLYRLYQWWRNRK